ncbi:MAG: alkaline phosphatase family protein [Pyrinomonadaceae bacterium]|nr:alkaline phosphatase family protein [Pyrinomonadaceae bacterium]
MKRKVLLLEINEITWDLIDPLIEAGKLPTFAKIKKQGTWADPMSVDLPPQLDPWITWTTVYTGRTQAEHNVFHLQQPPESIKAKRIWEICRDAGLKVGVFGSLGSYPPQEVDGFYVPDTFSPDHKAFPERLSPIQKLNLTYTRSVRLENDQDGVAFKAKLGKDLLKLGLSIKTCTRILRQLAREKVAPDKRWQRVILQPAVNFDFFSLLYKQNRPDFASFHTNHVAHFQHTYWKAMQPELFPQPTTEKERETYGGAIEFGYRSADELLSRAVALCDENTVLVVASSMGQKPYINDMKKGKQIGQLRSLDKLMEIIGLKDEVETLATMSDQFNIYTHSDDVKQIVLQRLASAYIDSPDKPMFYTNELEEFLTINLRHYDDVAEDSRCYFPDDEVPSESYRYEDLVYQTGHSKSGCHDPRGMLMIYGNGIKAGEKIDGVNNLDIAPTLLSLLGLTVPPEMTGRVLTEAFA